MPNRSRYYMSRVVKLGELTTAKVIQAIRKPATIQVRGTRFTFTDYRSFGDVENPDAVFARLAKYKPDGAVDVVNPDLHAVAEEQIDNLIEAASAFVYLPRYSGLAYRHVWNVLPRDQFERVFCKLVDAASDHGFFAQCVLEPITDLRTFVVRLSKLEKITLLSATVRPPNPLFGPCWESLSAYLRKRKLEEVQIKEVSEEGVQTNVQKIASVIAADGNAQDLPKLMEPLLDGVGDAALLMAADGYGKARVVGVEDNRYVTIRTSENQKSFLLDQDPNPEQLVDAALEQFERLNVDRGLRHS